jgi:acrylyl-CoA reductase (NADPH)/3-hydroxypropionyl-CoA dehydratase/3-hydroxypropionyl-CoA synthetase
MTEIRANAIRTRADWEAARVAAAQDPGRFHGEMAKREIYWFAPDLKAWVKLVDVGADAGGFASSATGAAAATGSGGPTRASWVAFDAATGVRLPVPSLASDYEPWARSFDDRDAPFYRWFEGGLTNACFNEVDVHVLAGRGDEVAFHFEGDRWDPALGGGRGGPVTQKSVTRRELLWQVAKCADALAELGLVRGDRIALNMPNILEQIYFIEAAKRLGVIYMPVFGGFSAKTLSDRIEDAGAKVVITTDGAYRNAQVVGFKEPFTDKALDDYVPVKAALRVVEAALATLSEVARERAAAIVSAIGGALAGEITVERADVMRGVGRALEAVSEWDARVKSRVRVAVAEALAKPAARVQAVVVIRHTGMPELAFTAGRDVWAHDLLSAAASRLLARARAAGMVASSEDEVLALPTESFVRAVYASTRPLPVDAEFPLFIIYTSGSTGKPKGVVHTHGGYVAGVAHTMRVSFDVPSSNNDNVICVIADPGWITGQSYLISAALTTGTTSVVVEGSPLFPHAGRFASIIERYKVTLFKAGSTFLKAVAADPQNVADVKSYDRSSLRVATFCAEPVSPSIQQFGMDLLTPQYINSYWATEHGGIVLTHFFGNSDYPLRPDAHTFALPWVFADVRVPTEAFEVDGRTRYEFRRAHREEKGEIVVTRPYPYLARTLWGDADRVGQPGWKGDLRRFTEIYYDRWAAPGSKGKVIDWAYTQGDYACRYEDGSLTLHGRSDDVINTSGHRIGTEEIEGAILKDKQLSPHSPVGNAIVVGAPHHEKGTVPLAFILTQDGRRISLEDERRLSQWVRDEKGPVAVPAGFVCVSQFPETRSGKYMRRFLKNLLYGEGLGDTTTLRNPESLQEIELAIREWRARASLEDESQMLDVRATLRQEVHAITPDGKLAIVTVQKPPVNALDERTLDELGTVIEHLTRRDDIKVVILTGAGTQSFVAGADIRQLLEQMHREKDVLPLCHKAARLMCMIERMPKPVIAAVNGVALGGGNEFQMSAHYRIAEERARFGQPEIALHLLPGYGGTQRLPRLLEERGGREGLLRAVKMILGGRAVDAREAAQIGLIDEVVEAPESVLSRATHLAREFVLGGHGQLGQACGPLADAHARRLRQCAQWDEPAAFPAQEVEAHPEIARLLAQAQGADRALPASWAMEALRYGYENGVRKGLEHEAELFARAVVHPQAGRLGLRAFFDRKSAPLPTRDRPELDRSGESQAELIASGKLLPVGSPMYPGVTPIPAYQYAWVVEKDLSTGSPRHGDPIRAETMRLLPVSTPGPNEGLVYMLSSEINFNDIWAITGVPVSPFDSHDEDWHVTGSGGLGLVVSLGSEAAREGRLKVGDLVAVFSGQSQLLSPLAGLDPMFAEQKIQGYETPDGSHQQFMVAQAPQLFPKAPDLTLEAAGSYVLNLGTIYRALFTTLRIEPHKTMFVEGAATGTGLEATKTAARNRVRVTGLVSSAERAKNVIQNGAHATIDRKDPRFENLFTRVPEPRAMWSEWERQGQALVQEFRSHNGGRLADYVVSHAGETAFPRSFQLLERGGVLTFYGASSGYHFTFIGKVGTASADAMLRRANLHAGEAIVVFYGSMDGGALDDAGLECIETVREQRGRAVVCTMTDVQREFVKSVGFGDCIRGAFSIEELKRREGDRFVWPETMPALPDARTETASLKEAVRWYQETVFKPFATQVGSVLKGPDNPRGVPDVIVERAWQDTLCLSSMLVKAHTGRVVFFEDMSARRYSFYAPQVWMRQRTIVMPSAEIRGTHLSNAHEVLKLNELIDAGLLGVTEPMVIAFGDAPRAHQDMWENRHRAATYVLNHAIPAMGLKTRDELYRSWSLRRQG